MERKLQLNLLILAAALFLAGCTGKETQAKQDEELLEPAGQAVATVAVTRQDVFVSEYLEAEVVPDTQELCFSVSGTVESCDVVIGSKVEKYQVLAKLDESSLVEQLEKIEQEIKEQENAFSYENALWDLETQSMQAEYKELEAKIAESNQDASLAMQMELLQLSLDKRDADYADMLANQEQVLEALRSKYDTVNAGVTENIMTAPFDGVVVFCALYEGAEVSANEYVLAVADMSAFYISCKGRYISESEYAKLYACNAYCNSEKIEIDYLAYSDEQIASAAVQGQILPARFLYTGGKGLNYGDYITVEMISEMAEDVLTVPSDAVFNDGSGKYVYKVTNGVKQRTEVFTGLDNGMLVEIESSGLAEGDEVYVPN